MMEETQSESAKDIASESEENKIDELYINIDIEIA